MSFKEKELCGESEGAAPIHRRHRGSGSRAPSAALGDFYDFSIKVTYF